MHTQVYRKWLLYLSISGLLASVLVGFYDIIFGYIFEAGHLLFEVVEMGLDKVVEHVFETEVHETQLIVFYIILFLGGVLIYLVWKALANVCKDFNLNCKHKWLELKTAITFDWQALSLSERIIYISLFCLINYLLSFLLF